MNAFAFADSKQRNRIKDKQKGRKKATKYSLS